MCNDDDEYDVQADLGSKEIDSADETSEDECIKTKPSKFQKKDTVNDCIKYKVES